MTKGDLVEGEIYFLAWEGLGDDEYRKTLIFRYLQPIPDDPDRVHALYKENFSDRFIKSTPFITGRFLRLATVSERILFEECERANKKRWKRPRGRSPQDLEFMIQNRKARYEYTLLEDFTAGMVLLGSEVKALRKGNANISDAFCVFINGELFIRNMHIDQYEEARTQHEYKRDRKLLLKRKELKRISSILIDKGITVVPTVVHNGGRTIKVVVAIAKGKKTHDKRQTIKERDFKRSMQRNEA